MGEGAAEVGGSGKSADQSPVNNSLSEVSVPQWMFEIADWASSSPIEGGRDEESSRWGRGRGEEEEECILFMGGNLTRGVPLLLAH